MVTFCRIISKSALIKESRGKQEKTVLSHKYKISYFSKLPIIVQVEPLIDLSISSIITSSKEHSNYFLFNYLFTRVLTVTSQCSNMKSYYSNYMNKFWKEAIKLTILQSLFLSNKWSARWTKGDNC